MGIILGLLIWIGSVCFFILKFLIACLLAGIILSLFGLGAEFILDHLGIIAIIAIILFVVTRIL